MNYLAEPLNEYMGYYFQVKEILYSIQTQYQKLEIVNLTHYGLVLRLDGVYQTSVQDEFLYHEPLVHLPAMTLGGPRNALVIGGGDGGTIEELLKYPTLEKVTMVELDGVVVDKCKEYLPKISNGAFESNKTELLIEDGIQYVYNTQDKFDQVILDLTDAGGPSLELYTREFYLQISNILHDGGILSLHTESPITRKEVFKRVMATLRSIFKFVCPVFNYVPLYGTLWGFAMASNYIDPYSVQRNQLDRQFAKFRLPLLNYYEPAVHYSLLTTPAYIRRYLKEPAEIFNCANIKNDILNPFDNFSLKIIS